MDRLSSAAVAVLLTTGLAQAEPAKNPVKIGSPTIVKVGPTLAVNSKPAPAPEPAPAETDYRATFLGKPDDDILTGICEQPIKSLEPYARGTTVRFKAVLADGSRALIRPEQSLEEAYYRADIAAYWLSRALSLGTVPPACERTFTRAELAAAAKSPRWQKRLDEIRWSKDGKTALASITMMLDLTPGELEKSMKLWRPLLVQGTPLGASPAARVLAAEASRMITWDFLSANWDRWSGDNTFRAGKDGPWVWPENAAGFGRYGDKAQRANENRLRAVERFSRSLITALRGPADEDLTAVLAPSGLSFSEVNEFLARRKSLLEHIDRLIEKHGEDKVLTFE